jgi:hypothetical protein
MRKKRLPRTPEAGGSALVKVQCRLYAADVEALQQQARDAGELDVSGWQPRLRLLVHRALRRSRAVGYVK